jgi:glycosyltransferase involved in cell wall biosynthesis
MHLAIDASRVTVARRTGTERYALNLIRAMLRQNTAHRLSLYFRDPPAPGLFPDLPAVARHVTPFPRLWTHWRLARELARRPRPDLLFVPAHVVPLICPVPAVVTVHDLGFRYFPGAHPWAQRQYLDLSTRYSTRAAIRVIADSQATRRDLQREYGVPEGKIRVVYPGRDEALQRVDPAAVRARYHLPETYILHVGTLQPRKNLVRLMEAVDTLPADVGLVLAGRPGWLAGPLLRAAEARAPRVRVLSFVPEEDLAGLYSGATVFAFPSLYEGFGFPVLEAMACGAPVVCSEAASLPEVAGEAAMRVNPLDTSALARALRQVLADPGLRARLAAAGYDQITRFSWERAARETWAVLEEALR